MYGIDANPPNIMLQLSTIAKIFIGEVTFVCSEETC